MQFTVAQTDFADAFNRVAPAVPTKTTLPILSNVLLRLEGNTLTLVATDLEISVLTEVTVQGAEDGNLCVPAKKIGDITRELDGLDLTFVKDDSLNLSIEAGKGKYLVPGISAQEFPVLPEFEGATELDLNVGKLDSLIQRTIFAVSRDELRPALTGVFMQIRNSEMRAVSTDGHRLVKVVDKTFKFEGDPRELIVPVKALDLIKRNLPDDGAVKCIIGETQLEVKLENTTIFSRLIEGKYPHYESVIPTNNDTTMSVSVQALAQAVKRVQIFANPIGRQVVFHITPGLLEIRAEDIELGGRGNEAIQAQYDGEEKTIGYNSMYILELMKHVKTDDVRFELGGPKQAGIVKPMEQEEGEDFLMLIMPVRLS